jgi:tetratricopeptide (TPR) repeat protein
MKFFALTIILAVLMLTGCNSNTKIKQTQVKPPELQSLINHALFEEQLTPSQASIFKLPDAEKKRFLTYVYKQLQMQTRADEIVFNYLESELSNFQYHGDTLTAQQTLDLSHGNCISLAILTQSYANELNLETSFQEMSNEPIYAKKNGLVYVSNHFRTKIYAPSNDSIDNDPYLFIIRRAGTLIDYFPSRGSYFSNNADYNDLVSKYYSNLAAQALADEQLDFAYSVILQAHKFTPYDPELYNIAGILHRRAGDLQSAKAIYQSALDSNLSSVNLLSNYTYLAQMLGDHELVSQLSAKLKNEQKDPFELLALAANDVRSGDLNRAKRHIEQAIFQAPYIAELYVELAKIKYQQGKINQTQTLLEKAIDLEHDKERLNVYQAKLLSARVNK